MTKKRVKLRVTASIYNKLYVCNTAQEFRGYSALEVEIVSSVHIGSPCREWGWGLITNRLSLVKIFIEFSYILSNRFSRTFIECVFF